MHTKYPHISIIIAIKNGSKVIKTCLESIIAQTYPFREIIIIDGASNDGTLPIIRDYQHSIAYWESKPDRGIYHAWNKALRYARGDWICFLGADDFFWNKKTMENLAPDLIKANQSGIRVVYGRVARINGGGRILKEVGKPWHEIYWQMRHGMPLPHPGLMHHRSLFEVHGCFDETFRIAGDYEFLLRELKDGKAHFVNLLTVGSNIGGVADSKRIMTQKEVFRAKRKNKCNALSAISVFVFLRACFRELLAKVR